MSTLRDLRKRVKAVKNTQKITKAMKMVAASKLRRAQLAVLQARPYALRMQDILEDVVSKTDTSKHPLLTVRVPRKVELVVMSSDRGLCGSFNSNITRTADRYLRENRDKFDQIQISTIGRKARDHFRRKGGNLVATNDGIWERLKYERASEIATSLSERFVRGELDAVYLVYNEFKSAISQKVVVKQLLPIQPLDHWEDQASVRVGELAPVSGNPAAVAGHSSDVSEKEGGEWPTSPELDFEKSGFEHIFEPSTADVLDALLPEHLAVQLWRAMLESVAAEHGARMSAMDAASRNAKDLIGTLTLQANRMRQAMITKELMEIVSGAEALK